MNHAKEKRMLRKRRHARVRASVSGTAARPRLCVSRSLSGIFAQLIDDDAGKTLLSIRTKKLPKKADAENRKSKVAESYIAGKTLAGLAKEKGIAAVVFDRSGYRYHGRVQAFAEGARDGGLTF